MNQVFARSAEPTVKENVKPGSQSIRGRKLLYPRDFGAITAGSANTTHIDGEDHIFKSLALGAPFTKLALMGRAVMIPGYLGANVEGVIKPEERVRLSGNWDTLPPNVAQYGRSADEIFAGYYDVEKKGGVRIVMVCTPPFFVIRAYSKTTSLLLLDIVSTLKVWTHHNNLYLQIYLISLDQDLILPFFAS